MNSRGSIAASGQRPRRKKSKWKRWLILGGGGVGLGSILIATISTILVVSATVIVAGLAWDRITNLFDDHDWKNAVKRVSSYQLEPGRDDLALYVPMYVDGKKVAEDDNAHWLNYGKLNSTFVKPKIGRSTYTFDLGREAVVDQFILVMACKDCSVLLATSEDNPPDPQNPNKRLSPDEIGAYYTPTQNFPALEKTARRAAANDIGTGRASTRYLTLFVENKDTEAYLVQVAAYPPGQHSNILWSGLPQFDQRYRSIYGSKLGQSLGLSGEQLLDPTTLYQLGQHTSYYGPLAGLDERHYLPVYPVVGTNPSRAGAGSAADAGAGAGAGYRPVYLGWQLPAVSVGKVQEVGIKWALNWSSGAGGPATPTPSQPGSPGSPTPTPGFGAVPTPTGAATSPTPGSSVTATTSATATPNLTPGVTATGRVGAGAGAGSLNAFSLEQPVSSSRSGSPGKAAAPNANLSKQAVIAAPASASIGLPQPPSATLWQVYLLDSRDAGDKALLDALFSSGGTATSGLLAGSEVTLPANRLLKEFQTSDDQTTHTLSLPTGDKRDTLVFVFEQSNFPQLLSALGNLDPNQAVSVPGQLAGLPADWLSPAQIYAYQQLPLAPLSPPRPASTDTHASSGPSTGEFDLRWGYGKITPQKIEEIIASKPWTGIASDGTHAGEPPSPNKLSGKGQVIYDLGQKYGINPAYAVAFALKETELGTTGYHVFNASSGQWGYNLYGMSNHGNGAIWDKVDYCKSGFSGRFCGYDSFDQSIEEFYNLLSAYVEGRMLIRDGDLTIGQKACPCLTIDRVLYWYAPKTENDTDLYIEQVEGWVTSWGAKAPPAGTPGGPPLPPGGGGSGGNNPNSPVPAINQYDCSQYSSAYPCGLWADSTCGPTSATMLINWVSGANLRVADTLGYGGYHGVDPSEGTYSWDYLDAMKDTYGFKWQRAVFNSSDDYIAGLKSYTAAGQPVIVNIVGSPYNYGHFFVVVRYEAEDNQFVINDPANVTQPGNPPGVVQRWPSQKLQDYLERRTGSTYPAILISAANPASSQVTPTPAPGPAARLFKGLASKPTV